MSRSILWALLASFPLLCACDDTADDTSGDDDSMDSGPASDAAGTLDTSPGDGDGDGDTDASAADDAGSFTCPAVGTWELESIVCATTDVTDGFRMTIPTTIAVITQSESGGCDIVLTNENDACHEEQSFHDTPIGDTWMVASSGITACDPDACVFNESDAPCEIGDRVETFTESVTFDGEDRFSSTRASGGICAAFSLSPTIFTWTRATP